MTAKTDILTAPSAYVATPDDAGYDDTASKGRSVEMYRHFFKRALDILISLTALIVFSPLMLLLAVCVRIALGGPVIFKQVRPGKGGRLFYIYKFRTMSDKRDANGELLPDELRVTTFSRLLRKTSLDELPQIINILKGDMSLIGPRPRLVKDAVFYDSFKSLEVRPGLTGKSQVCGRNDNTWDQVFRYDAEYADNLSFGMDVSIFFRTFPALLRSGQSEKRDNKYYPDELLHHRIITQSQYDEGLRVAEKIVSAFTERGEQIMREEIIRFHERLNSYEQASKPSVTRTYPADVAHPALGTYEKVLHGKGRELRDEAKDERSQVSI